MNDRTIDITAKQRKTVLALLARYLPNATVWVYGSRAEWTSRPQSDLDLVVFATPEQNVRVGELREAFEDSNLPFRVDLFVWDAVPEQFRKHIKREHVVLVEKEERDVAGEWVHCTLADTCIAIHYGLTASASNDFTGPKFLRITDIVSGQLDWNTVPHVVAEDEIIAKYRLYDGDIVIARTGASTGASLYVKNPPLAVFASYLVRLQAKPDFDARFLAYYLKSKEFWRFIRGVLGDKSAQPNASASTMTAAPLSAPKDKTEQRAIAHILGTLDDKIELNRRMNETLEAMARALFKSWFVDFDPVRAKMAGRDTGLPKHLADLFPDRLVDSELGPIPEGWEVVSLDSIATFLNGLALQKYPVGSGSALPVIKIAQLRAGHTLGADLASSDLLPQYVVHDGDVLFSWSGSLELDTWTGGDGALNQHLFKVTSAEYPKWLYYHWVREHLPGFREIAAGKVTTMGHIQRHHLSEAATVIPNTVILEALNRHMQPLLERGLSLRVESRALAALRDALLPKLISGDLRVKDAETFLERVH